jgi:gamma-tubulin complex component 3
MLPEFIPMKEAKKILSTGKAVNLLLLSSVASGRDRLDLPGFDDLKEVFEKTNVESLFRDSGTRGVYSQSNALNLLPQVEASPLTPSTSSCSSAASFPAASDFRKLLDKAFQEVSSKAMRILFDDHQLLEHLKGLRQFLLLGQGDFIRHLMDLVTPELDKEPHRLQAHALNCLLSQAIQGTNAQFLPEEIINRLECVLLDRGIAETGWDVFSLSYQTRGPIGTILTTVCMEKYSKLFQHLWRSKRMEYLLTGIKKDQMKRQRIFLPHIPKMKILYHQNFFLLQEMTHFLQQMQYYIEFEVIECSWSEFTSRLKSSMDIDQVVEAHESFLKVIYSRALLDEASQTLCVQLRAVYEIILQFKKDMASFDKILDKEVRSLGITVSDPISVHASNLSLTSVASSATSSSHGDFETKVIPEFTKKFKQSSETYHDMVQRFLLLLASHDDLDVQFLNTRIDFNEHYKKRNKSLETSFTYSHRYSFGTPKNSFRE